MQEIDTRALTKKLRVDGAMKRCLSTADIYRRRGRRPRPRLAGHGRRRLREGRHLPAALSLGPDGPARPRAYLPVGTTLGAHAGPGEALPGRRLRLRRPSTPFSATRAPRLRRARSCPATATADAGAANSARTACSSPTAPAIPAALGYVHETVRGLLPARCRSSASASATRCSRHALGGTTFKLKFGHRGGNQPVKNLETGKV